MGLHIYSVKAKSQAGDIQVKDMTAQKGQKSQDTQLGSLKFRHFAGKFSRGPRVQERALLGLRIHENTPKKLPHLPPKSCRNSMVQGRG